MYHKYIYIYTYTIVFFPQPSTTYHNPVQVGLVHSKLHSVTTMREKLKHVWAMAGEKLLASRTCMRLQHGMQHWINNCVSPRDTPQKWRIRPLLKQHLSYTALGRWFFVTLQSTKITIKILADFSIITVVWIFHKITSSHLGFPVVTLVTWETSSSSERCIFQVEEWLLNAGQSGRLRCAKLQHQKWMLKEIGDQVINMKGHRSKTHFLVIRFPFFFWLAVEIWMKF